MAVYAAFGLVLAALALLLFRRRAMERAGDAVAFDVLKPLFRFCMALGCAIVLPAVVFDWRHPRLLPRLEKARPPLRGDPRFLCRGRG